MYKRQFYQIVELNRKINCQRESNIPRIGMLYNSDPKSPVVVVVVVVVLSNVDVGDPRCPVHGEDAIFTHEL